MTESKSNVSNNKLAVRLAYFISAAWGISFLVDIPVKSYDPPPTIHALMMLVAGAVFGDGLIRARSGNSSKKEEDKGDKDE